MVHHCVYTGRLPSVYCELFTKSCNSVLLQTNGTLERVYIGFFCFREMFFSPLPTEPIRLSALGRDVSVGNLYDYFTNGFVTSNSHSNVSNIAISF